LTRKIKYEKGSICGERGELVEVAEVLDKIFPCLGCRKNVKLKRNDAHNGWIRYEMDGHAIHDCPVKKQKPKGVAGTAAVDASQLESKIDVLIAEIQALRKDLQ
jgi:hypothetical protein